jgi:aminoglycoside phosphotransferase (APT) family kinase protein
LANAPELAEQEVVELGQGLDNSAFVVGELVLRVAHGPGVACEARLLEHLAPRLSIPIPTPRFADENAGVMGYRRIPGRPLLGRRAPSDAAARLGRFLRELHTVDIEPVTDFLATEDADPSAWLEELDGPRDLIRLVHARRPRQSRRRVVAHADLGAEHILELDGTLTGVIDWSDAAITDPALDFARLYRDFGPGFLAQLLGSYGPVSPPALSRIEFFARCAALEDLAFGSQTGRHEYIANAKRSLAWLFPHTTRAPSHTRTQ